MKTAINLVLGALILALIVSGIQINFQADNMLNQLLSGMEMIKALLLGIIVAIVNKK